MPSRSPLRPIFDPGPSYGSVNVGAMIGEQSAAAPVPVTINQAVGQPDPDTVSPVLFAVEFEETVTGFATGDVTLSGTAGGTLVGTVSGSGASYTVAVTGMTTAGTIIATIVAGVATGTVTFGLNAASTSVDNTVTWGTTSAPSSLSILGSVQVTTNIQRPNDVALNWPYAYLTRSTGGAGGGISIVDVTDPTDMYSPGVSYYDNAANDNASGIAYNGAGVVFVVHAAPFANGQLTAFDVSDWTTPTPIGNVPDLGYSGASGLILVGNTAFTSHGDGAFVAVNVSDPTAMTILGDYQDFTNLGGANRFGVLDANTLVMSCFAGTAGFTGSIAFLDVTDPTSMSVIYNLSHATNLSGPQDLDVVGSDVFVAVYNTDRLTIIDGSNPASPTITSSVTNATKLNEAYGISVYGAKAYTTRQAGRVTVTDISNLALPVVGNSYTSGTSHLNGASFLTAANGKLYIPCFTDHGLTVMG